MILALPLYSASAVNCMYGDWKWFHQLEIDPSEHWSMLVQCNQATSKGRGSKL